MAFDIIPHRGDSAAAPENTFAAFDCAISKGFTCFETDCQLSKDGVCMIVHDETLGRTNDGTGCVKDMTAEQLQVLDAGSWFEKGFQKERIPTLEQLLQKYLGRVHIHLELKSTQPALPESVATVIKACVASINLTSPCSLADCKITVTSFHLLQLQTSQQLLPELKHAWLVQELDGSVISQAVKHGIREVCPRANVCTKQAVEEAKTAGLDVRAWGIKTLELLDNMVECGCYGATVNWPDVARDHLHKKQQRM